MPEGARRAGGGTPDGRRRPPRDRPDPRDARAWAEKPVYVSARGARLRAPALPPRSKAAMTSPTSQDLAALAVPVRHEANNLLASLLGTIEILLRTAEGERERARAERLRESALRIETLMKAYLSLAAPPASDGGTDAAQVLAVLRPLVVLTLGPGREVEIAAAADLPRLALRAADLQAIVLRLAREAAALAPAGAGLRLSLEPAAGGVMLRAEPMPGGPAPPPIRLPAEPPLGTP